MATAAPTADALDTGFARAFGTILDANLTTLITAAILYFGMSEVARRLDTALASETRMARYSSLSTQASTFLVVGPRSARVCLYDRGFGMLYANLHLRRHSH